MHKSILSIITPGNGARAAHGADASRASGHEPPIALTTHPARRSADHGILVAGRRAIAAWRRVRRLRRAVRELSSIGVYRLTDVGIPPGQIPEVAEALLARSIAAETLASFPVPPSAPAPRAEHRGAA